MPNSVANNFTDICSVGNGLFDVSLKLEIGYGQQFTTPVPVSLHGTSLSPAPGNPLTYSLGSAKSLQGQTLSIDPGVKIINAGPPCKASVRYTLVSSNGLVLNDDITELNTTLGSTVCFNGTFSFQ